MDKQGYLSLVDLPDTVLQEVLRLLPLKSNLTTALVCKAFNRMLSTPAPATFVWEAVEPNDALFARATFKQLSRQTEQLP